MDSKFFMIVVSILVILGFGPADVSAVEVPQGVSPGAPDRMVIVKEGCTTFSWQEIEGATVYEITTFAVDESAHLARELQNEQYYEVFSARVPGGATSWTPEAARCPAPGGYYAWFVRAIFDMEGIETGPWSDPLYFAVPAQPTPAEIEHALDVLLRHLEAETQPATTEAIEVAARIRSARSKSSPRSVVTGTAAIKGEQPDATGETYGVVGISASPDGAGIGAANTGGGPDLVLDGSADTEPDTALSQSGIDRPSGTPQAFGFSNSEGGGISLLIDDVEVVTVATDQDTLDALSCDSGQIVKWDPGAGWYCASDVNTDTLSDLACRENEVAKMIGGIWVCAPDADLLADLNCSVDEVAKWDGEQWECAEDKNTTYTFGPGLAVSDGQIVVDPAAFSIRTTTVDSTSVAGEWSSLAIGTDGLALIAYEADGDLKTAHCSDLSCTTATLSPVGNTANSISLAIGSDGLGLISYGNTGLKVAHCDNVECTSITTNTVDSGIATGYTSVAIGADNLGLISYFDDTNNDLKVAHCDDTNCSSATVSTLDSSIGAVGPYSSVAIGTDGLGLISYYYPTGGALKVAHCDNELCTSATKSTLDSADDTGQWTSVAIGADGFGLISYYDVTEDTLKVAHCVNTVCGAASILSPGGTGNGGQYSSLAVGPDGLGFIAFKGTGEYLSTAHCVDPICSSATVNTVPISVAGGYNSAAFGIDGRALVSTFRPWPVEALSVAHLPLGY